MKKLLVIIALITTGAFLYQWWCQLPQVPEFSDELNEIICFEEGIR